MKNLTAQPVSEYSPIRTYTQDAGAVFIHDNIGGCILILPLDLEGLRDALDRAIIQRDSQA